MLCIDSIYKLLIMLNVIVCYRYTVLIIEYHHSVRSNLKKEQY